jgi:hypothetical protein
VGASIKASYFATTIAALDVLGPEKAAIARARCSESIELLARVSRADWIPVEHDVVLSQIVFDLGGVQAVRDVNRVGFLQSIEGPMLRPLFNSAVTIFGLTPRALLKLFQRGWDSGMREGGEVRLSTDQPMTATVLHDKYPASDVWREGLAGIVEGMYEATRHTGTVTMTTTRDCATYPLHVEAAGLT